MVLKNTYFKRTNALISLEKKDKSKFDFKFSGIDLFYNFCAYEIGSILNCLLVIDSNSKNSNVVKIQTKIKKIYCYSKSYLNELNFNNNIDFGLEFEQKYSLTLNNNDRTQILEYIASIVGILADINTIMIRNKKKISNIKMIDLNLDLVILISKINQKTHEMIKKRFLLIIS